MLPFDEIALGVGGLACARCGTAEEVRYRSAEEIVGDLEHAGPNVALVGPEPFGHEALSEIVAAARRTGAVRLRLDTDAAALRDDAIAGDMLEAGVRHVRATLLGGAAEAHDALLGERGAFEATLGGLRRFCEVSGGRGERVAISVRVPVCRHSAQGVPATVVAAAGAGATSVLLAWADPGSDPAAALPWVFASCDTGTVNSVWVEVEGLPFCMAPGYALHVADVVRPRDGAKAEACGSCALDPLCGGASPGAGEAAVGALAPPRDADTLADRVGRARGEVA